MPLIKMYANKTRLHICFAACVKSASKNVQVRKIAAAKVLRAYAGVRFVPHPTFMHIQYGQTALSFERYYELRVCFHTKAFFMHFLYRPLRASFHSFLLSKLANLGKFSSALKSPL